MLTKTASTEDARQQKLQFFRALGQALEEDPPVKFQRPLPVTLIGPSVVSLSSMKMSGTQHRITITFDF